MEIQTVKLFDFNNITLVYELEGCPEDCTACHDDLDDDEQGHDFNSHHLHEEDVFEYHFAAEREDEWEDNLDTIAEAYETQELDRQDRLMGLMYSI